MHTQVTGEHFVIRSDGTYSDRLRGDVTPMHEDFGTFDRMPVAEEIGEAVARFIDLRESVLPVGIMLNEPAIVHETRVTRRLLGINISKWHVVETIPVRTVT